MSPINSPGDRITPTGSAPTCLIFSATITTDRDQSARPFINGCAGHEPDQDWSWIRRLLRPVQARYKPARPKRPRLVATSDLFDLGLALMAAAERKNPECRGATAFRDGLIIALLAVRPLRMRNLVGLTLDRTLVRRGEQWWIQIPAAETKTWNR